MQSYTISKLNEEIKSVIQKNIILNKNIAVTGEISNLKISGKHTYMTLKDDLSSISTVFWNKQLDSCFNNGDNVEIIGKLDLYIKTGNINLLGFGIKNIGVGQLHKEYELLYKKYESLGYYLNKKQLPTYVKNIALITASEGAALQDLLYVLNKNGFKGNVYIYNCSVQGVKCPSTVVEGIKYFNNNNNKFKIDILIVTRGGGSFEDLMGYSHPSVVEEIYKSKIYTISAIGHEVDNMLSDYVANYRAPTPSIAGEVISTIYQNNLDDLNKMSQILDNIKKRIEYQLKEHSNNILFSSKQIVNPFDILNDKLTMFEEKLITLMENKMVNHKNKIINFEKQLINPWNFLETSINILEEKGNMSIKLIFNNYYNKINYINRKIICPYDLLDEKIKIYQKQAIFNINELFRNYHNKIKQLTNTLEKNDHDSILNQGFVLLVDSNGDIIMDINNIFANPSKKLKLIHSTGTFNINITKSI